MVNILPPPNGQPLLTDLPAYGGSGGDILSARFYAGQDFVKQFDRRPSEAELDLLAPAYVGDPHVANLAGGAAAIAQYYVQLAQKVQDTPAPEVQASIDKVNDLNAQAAVATAQAQLTLANQAAAEVSLPQAPSAPSLQIASDVGGRPIGDVIPPPGAPTSSGPSPIFLGTAAVAVALYFFRKKIFGLFAR